MKLLKLKAGALQLTIFIGVVVALLLASVLMLVHTHKRFNIQSDFVVETVKNSQKGINYALNNNIPLMEKVFMNNNNAALETSIKRDFWGVYEKINSATTIKNNTIKRVALIGAQHPDEDRLALYLKDNNKPLVLVGNTTIQGQAFLPQQGVRPGNISGTSYYGTQLIYGDTHLSKGLPKIPNEVLSAIESYLKNADDYSVEDYLDLAKTQEYHRSFHDTKKVIYEIAPIELSKISLSGHIIVHSKSKITVDASSHLKDVLLIAPEISINDNVKGRFQAIASKKITVGYNCELNYPSALVLRDATIPEQNNTNQYTNQIKVQSQSVISGTILYDGESKKNNFKSQIIIEEDVIIKGEIYCNQNIDLRGHVYGSVYTNNFIAAQSGSVYQNHIYNASITIDKLPMEYVGLSFTNSNKEVMQWLY